MVENQIWWKGDSLLTFLNKNGISQNIYFKLSKTDKELCSEINAGVEFQIMYDDKHKLKQALIPISEQMQLHIFKNKNDKYILDIIPIIFTNTTQTIIIPITYSPYQDILTTTKNQALANEFIRAFRRSINFKRIQKGDILAIKYTQKIRVGRYFGVPSILGAKIEVNGHKNYIFQNNNDKRYYDDKARSLSSFFMKVPLRYKRISSKFTQKRWHPILKKYRAHLGVDYAAPKGRKIHATANGKVIFKGRKGGYGNTVIVRHKGGYKSLYAHMSKFARIRVGQYIKQGKTIGYVGTTGQSTGPHLHFGLYKNGRAINPYSVLSVTKTQLKGKTKKIFLKYISKIKKELNQKVSKKEPLKLESFKLSYNLE
jgi:murein DD-endopeptidase MepM/ murein hydrolase activator NlpD